jgi:hypothetical protein
MKFLVFILVIFCSSLNAAPTNRIEASEWLKSNYEANYLYMEQLVAQLGNLDDFKEVRSIDGIAYQKGMHKFPEKYFEVTLSLMDLMLLIRTDWVRKIDNGFSIEVGMVDENCCNYYVAYFYLIEKVDTNEVCNFHQIPSQIGQTCLNHINGNWYEAITLNQNNLDKYRTNE